MATKSSFKNMTICLTAICLVCSSLLAGIYAITKDPIDAAQKVKTTNAIKAVLPEFGELSELQTVDVNGKTFKYYTATTNNELKGWAIESSSVGFGGTLKLMVGITADGIIFNTSVLSQSETPGLGAKCVEPAFHDQFKQLNPAETVFKVKKDQGDIDAITASTITSRAYLVAVETAVSVYKQLAANTISATAADESAAEPVKIEEE